MTIRDYQIIRQVIIDQQEEASFLLKQGNVPREMEQQIKSHLDDKLIKVIMGVRRCGKSVLAHRVLEGQSYAYINFDDERLYDLSSEQLNDVLEILLEVYEKPRFLLFDEIQNIESWELFINRLSRQGFNIVITGSNSQLLSKELTTHLTGRHIAFEIFPFSFQEFLMQRDTAPLTKAKFTTKQRAELKRYFNDYLLSGGFPELRHVTAPQRYLRDLYDKIINRDLASRYKVKHAATLRDIALYTLSQFAARATYHKIKNVFEIGSVHTVKNYMNYLEEAYVLFQLPAFSHKPKEVLRAARKLYGIDSGFIQAVVSQTSPNSGRLLENIVFLQLRRKLQSLSYYRSKDGLEVDFVIGKGPNVSQLIQVAADISDPKTEEREFKALIQVSEELKCDKLLLITLNTEAQESYKGKHISIVPIWRWLLES